MQVRIPIRYGTAALEKRLTHCQNTTIWQYVLGAVNKSLYRQFSAWILISYCKPTSLLRFSFVSLMTNVAQSHIFPSKCGRACLA